MNRICQSSFGNLEAVINIANYRGHEERRLVHFTRDRMSGEWMASAVVSEKPMTGGSIIQNICKPKGQDHGDFEVLVVEIGGVVRHYTRDNTIADEIIWNASTVVNTVPKLLFTTTLATDAVPLIQTRIPMQSSTSDTCLETAVLEDSGNMIHYRCPMPGGSESNVE